MSIKNVFDYPPYLHLIKVLEHCPKAGMVYFKIWIKRNTKTNALKIDKFSVREEYTTSLAKFRHDIFLLQKEGIINFKENESHVEIIFLPVFEPYGCGKIPC